MQRQKFNSLILSFLSIIALPTLQAVPSFHSIGSTIYKNTYLLTYLAQSMLSNKTYRKQKPIANWPQEDAGFPNAQELALDIKHAVSEIKANKKNEFLLGASTSEHQCSNECTPEICSWSRFANNNNLIQPNDIQYPCDFWNNYKQYITDLKNEIGINSLRISVEWPLVQPENSDDFDQKALDHYADLYVELIKQGITPIVCLHHYTDPCWFIDGDGFETEESSKHFENFCLKMYETLTRRLDGALCDDTIKQDNFEKMPKPLWATFNSPEGYAFKGYREFTSPPSNPEKKGLNWAMKVLKNTMIAHKNVYRALHKEYDEIKNLQFKEEIGEPKIGILKNIHQLDPANKTWKQTLCKPLSRLVCNVGNMLQHDSIFSFFTEGTFGAHIPTQVEYDTQIYQDAIGAVDWIGLNYYSNGIMDKTKKLTETDEKFKTDNTNYRFYPEGLYRAIAEVDEKMAQPISKIKNKPVPIYVTENGIATQDDEQRNKFYQQYLYALKEAIKDGYDVRGYLTWTAFDNYEWAKVKKELEKKQEENDKNDNSPQDRRVYGLCKITENGAHLERKNGASFFTDSITAYNNGALNHAKQD